MWTDIGVNLTDKRFSADWQEVVSRASGRLVRRQIITSTSLQSAERAISFCEQQPGTLFCTVGVHPHDADHYDHQTQSQLKKLSQHPSVVAIGETGLDFNRNFSTQQSQIAAFHSQLELAADTTLPLFLHERDAAEEQLAILKQHRDSIIGGVCHCFTGDRESLFAYLDLDLYIGITGWICDERRGLSLQELVKEIPKDRLLLETDAPYLTPRTLRPKPKSGRNLPEYLPHIAEQVAHLRQQSIESLSQQTEENVNRLFALDG